MSCDICGEEKEDWEMHIYHSGLRKCKIHSKGYRMKYGIKKEKNLR